MHIDYVSGQIDNASQRAIKCVSKGKNCTLNCTSEEFDVLRLIAESPSITQKEMAKRIGKSERTVKTRVASLKNKGYIRRLNGKRNGMWEVLFEGQ